MRVQERDFGYLWDMLDAAVSIREFTRNVQLGDYIEDEILQSAVERKLEILGEAARSVSKGFKRAHSRLPWRQLIAQRNFIVHEYGKVDNAVIWRMVQSGIPELIRMLEPLIPPIPKEDF